jgi:hypothetical protein
VKTAIVFVMLLVCVQDAGAVTATVSRSLGNSKRLFSLEVITFSGVGSANTTPASSSVGELSLGLTGSILVTRWFGIGVTPSYSFLNQYSPTSDSGNLRGSRWEINPTVSFIFNKILIKGEYELIGKYVLTNKSLAGATITYGTLSGYRLSLCYIFKRVLLGAFYESSSYKTISFSESFSDRTLDPALVVTQAGLILGYRF